MEKEISPEVGMGATYIGYSDRDPYTIIKVCTARKIIVQEDECTAKKWEMDFHAGGFCGHVSNQQDQQWEITPNLKGKTYTLLKDKKGHWHIEKSDTCFIVGHRTKFYDYNF